MRKSIPAFLLVAGIISVGVMSLTAYAVGQEREQKTQKKDRGATENVKRTSSTSRPRVIQYPRLGRQVRALPQRHRNIRVGDNRYHYHAGAFYRPGRTGVYTVVRGPLGARVSYLPPGYIGFYIGPQRYSYVNFTYYMWDTKAREYVVVEEPEGAEEAVVAASESASGEIFIYPNEGQTEEQRDRDRYECYVWAVKQTGFDPDTTNPQADKALDYRRANSACLEGRGYTVK